MKEGEEERKYLHATFTDDTYYHYDGGYVDTNTSEENIKLLEERFKKKFPRKSIRMPPLKEKDDCKCFLSVDLKMVPSGNKVGDIGVNVVDKVNKHVNRMCPVHNSGTVPADGTNPMNWVVADSTTTPGRFRIINTDGVNIAGGFTTRVSAELYLQNFREQFLSAEVGPVPATAQSITIQDDEEELEDG